VVEVPVEADYKNEHTSHDLRGAALYSISTFGILGAYLLAKLGIRYDGVFPRKNVDASQSNSRP